MPWILRVTDRVAINKRAAYQAKLLEVAAAMRDVFGRSGLPVRYIGSARVAFGKDNYEYEHQVWFANLGDFESDRIQETEICRKIREAYAAELFIDSRWEFLEVVPSGGADSYS